MNGVFVTTILALKLDVIGFNFVNPPAITFITYANDELILAVSAFVADVALIWVMSVTLIKLSNDEVNLGSIEIPLSIIFVTIPKFLSIVSPS